MHGYVITCLVKCAMKLFVNSKTSTVCRDIDWKIGTQWSILLSDINLIIVEFKSWIIITLSKEAFRMMTPSDGNIFRVTGPLCGKFTGHRWIPPTKVSDAELWCFFDLCQNKRLSKQSRRRWFEAPSHSFWRHCNGLVFVLFHHVAGMEISLCFTAV